MSVPAAAIVSEHHVELVGSPSRLWRSVDFLRPYVLTQGIWYVKILYVSSTKPLKTDAPFSTGHKVVSLNVTSGNEKELILASFSDASFERERRAISFDRGRYFRINHPSDRIFFQVRQFGSEAEVEIEEGGQMLLGVSLVKT